MIDLAAVLAQAVDNAVDVVSAALEDLSGEPPDREELRARFEEVLAAPDEATREQLRGVFDQHFGVGAYAREWALKLTRENKP